jgi:hypothetical protein
MLKTSRTARTCLWFPVFVLLSVMMVSPLVRGDESIPAGRDPFVPLVGADRDIVNLGIKSIYTLSDLKFEGITTGARGEKLLILNGELIAEGETIGSVSVVEVASNSAIVLIEGVRHRITLYE